MPRATSAVTPHPPRMRAAARRIPLRSSHAPQLRLFSSSRPALSKDSAGDAPPPPPNDKKQRKKADEPQDTTVAGRSPFQAFVDVLKDEVRKNREFQDSVKQLQGEASKVQDSEAMKKAKEVYERARVSPFFLCCGFARVFWAVGGRRRAARARDAEGRRFSAAALSSREALRVPRVHPTSTFRVMLLCREAMWSGRILSASRHSRGELPG